VPEAPAFETYDGAVIDEVFLEKENEVQISSAG
jgi:hypothetical protein